MRRGPEAEGDNVDHPRGLTPERALRPQATDAPTDSSMMRRETFARNRVLRSAWFQYISIYLAWFHGRADFSRSALHIHKARR
jgi:hypothetical protein